MVLLPPRSSISGRSNFCLKTIESVYKMDSQHLTNTMMAMMVGQTGQKDPLELIKLMLMIWGMSYVKSMMEWILQWCHIKFLLLKQVLKHPGSEQRFDYNIESTSSQIAMNDYYNEVYLNDGLLFFFYKHTYKTERVFLSRRITIEDLSVRVRIPFQQEIKLKEDLYFYMDVKIFPRRKYKEGMMIDSYNHFVSVRLYSKHHYFDYIDSFLNEWDQAFFQMIKQGQSREVKKLRPLQKQDKHCCYSSHLFKSKKTFDNLFFEEKEYIVSRLALFVKNKEEYERLGIPYNLGFLFHGEAGTGKTSCIKAIANYLKRDLYVVNLTLVRTNEKLLEILEGCTEELIFVFEEIDCCGQLLLDRGETSSLTPLSIQEQEEDRLTLGSILEILDGIIEQPGRICIFTTNYPERIDKALLRPGRIDMIVEFKKMRKQDVRQMYQLWFHTDIPSKLYDKMKDYTYSQAEIGNLFQKYQDKPKIILSHLK